MASLVSDEMLGAYVDRELDPAFVLLVEAAIQRSPAIRRRIAAICALTPLVRSSCEFRRWNISGESSVS
jgi:anti-sigma factor RsiW